MTSDEKNFLEMQNRLLEIEKEADEEIIRAYAVAYREILGKIKKLYDKYAKNGDLSNMDKTELKRLTSIEQECIRILEQAHAEVARIIKERSMFAYGESFFRHAYYIDDTYEVNLNWGKVPENAVEVAVEDGFEMVANSKTFQQAKNPSIETLKEIFTNSLIEGKSYDKVKEEIVKKIGVETVADDAARYVGKGAASWANMVARTEIHRAISLGQKKTEKIVEENGLNIEWVWLATLDGRTRPSHGALDGIKKDIENDGWFVPAIGWVKGPGLSKVASFDINCRCCVMPVAAGTMPEERRVRGEGIVPYKNYREWKESKVNSYEQVTEKTRVIDGSSLPGKDTVEKQIHFINRQPDQIPKIEDRKLTEYILDKNSKDPSKAIGFEKKFGITGKDYKYLQDEISRALKTSGPVKMTKVDSYGVSYRCVRTIKGLNGRESDIIIGISFDRVAKDADAFNTVGRIVTVIPGK